MESAQTSLQTKADLVVRLPRDCHRYNSSYKQLGSNKQWQAPNKGGDWKDLITGSSSTFCYHTFITFSTESCASQMEDLAPLQSEANACRERKGIADSQLSPGFRHADYKAGRWGRDKHLKSRRKEENLHEIAFFVLSCNCYSLDFTPSTIAHLISHGQRK